MSAEHIRRLLEHGAQTLSDAELVAVILSIQVDVARNVLALARGDLRAWSRLNAHEMNRVKGLGWSKCAVAMAATELSRRLGQCSPADRASVRSSADAFNLLHPVLGHLPHEEFWLLVLDRGNRLMERVRVSMGGYHGTVADPKVIFKTAIDRRASCVVLAHNHPSGQLRPSEEDLHLTRKLHEGGRLLDIAVQDHLIITQAGYYSFADQGQL